MAPFLNQHRRTVDNHKEDDCEAWREVRSNWEKLQSMLVDANKVIDAYNRSAAGSLKDLPLATMPEVNQLRKSILSDLNALAPRGNKRKAT